MDFIDSLRSHFPIIWHVGHLFFLNFRYNLLFWHLLNCAKRWNHLLMLQINFAVSWLIVTFSSLPSLYCRLFIRLIFFCTERPSWNILLHLQHFTWRSILALNLNLRILVTVWTLFVCLNRRVWIGRRRSDKVDIAHWGKHVLLGQRRILLLARPELGRLHLFPIVVILDQNAWFFHFWPIFGFWRLFVNFAAKSAQIVFSWRRVYLFGLTSILDFFIANRGLCSFLCAFHGTILAKICRLVADQVQVYRIWLSLHL